MNKRPVGLIVLPSKKDFNLNLADFFSDVIVSDLFCFSFFWVFQNNKLFKEHQERVEQYVEERLMSESV